MFKKFLQIITTLGLLVFGHAVYVRGFAIVMVLVGMPENVPPLKPMAPGASAGARKAEELAHRAFGINHWTSKTSDLFVYYEPLRGFWLYAKNYEQLNGNKRLKLSPFAMAWRPHEGGPIKTLQAAEAIIDFDQALEPGKSGAGSPHMVWAKVSKDILIRNDKGTPNRLDDDLVIDQLTYLEFDEKKLLVESDSPTRIQDKGIKITGTSMQIHLWPRELGQSGFEPKTATLKKDIQIDMDDVGQSGIVPGATPVVAATAPGEAPAARVAKPAKLTCRGPMEVALPKGARPVKWGPPAPKGPTLAEFYRDVMVKQGLENPDQLNSDVLHLTLVPAEKVASPPRTNPADVAPPVARPAAPAAGTDPAGAEAASDDVLGSLVLSKAHATGHAVWLQSPSEGTRSMCQEMIYERHLPEAPDKTYLRADKIVWVEKIGYIKEGPSAGKIQSVDIMETVDINIFQYGPNGGPPTMVARGPGWLETRPDKTKPIERRVSWNDRLEVQNVRGVSGDRRKITLVGSPKVYGLTQKAKIEADDRIIAYLKPNDPAEVDAEVIAGGEVVAKQAASKASAREGDTMAIEFLEAHRNAVLETLDDAEVAAVAPQAQIASAAPRKKSGKQTVRSRDRLDVVFTKAAQPKPKSNTPEPAPAAAAPANAPAGSAVAAANPPAGTAVAANGAAAPADKPADAAEEPPAVEQDPPMVAQGNYAWARVMLYPRDETVPAEGQAQSIDGSVEKARLRGAVTIHQGPAAGKKRGTDVTADQVDMEAQAEGLSEYHAEGTLENPAVIITDKFLIKGPFIGVDQAGNYQWSNRGPGMLIEASKEDDELVQTRYTRDGDTESRTTDSKQRASGTSKPAGRSQKSENAIDEPKDETDSAAPKKKPRGPMTVTWTREMKFWGNTETDDHKNDGPGKAVFYGHVRAWTSDSTVVCNEKMIAMLDKAVSLKNRPKSPAQDAAETEEEKPPAAKITWIRCLEDVEINRYKLDPITKFMIGRDQLFGPDVFYDVPTGDFDIAGKGLARHYEWVTEKDEDSSDGSKRKNERTGPTMPLAGARVRQTAYDPQAPKKGARANAQAKAAAKKAEADKAKAESQRRAKETGPQPARGPELTRITFEQRAKGRFGGDVVEGGPAKGPTTATFWGDVFVLRAKVADFKADLDPDCDIPPPDQFRMTCNTLYVESTPIAKKDGDARPAAARDRRDDSKKEETSRTELTGWGNVALQDGDKTGQGDRMTEDSEKGLVWLYGEKSLATLTQQPIPGATPTSSSGDAFWYNRKTGQSGVVNARDVQFTVDPRKERGDVNSRRLSAPGPTDSDPKRKPRLEPKLTPRANMERQGFRGR